jgi:ketosteroid isomerase-like protein
MEQKRAQTEFLIISFLQRVGGGDADAIAELFTDEVNWSVPGNDALPWIGERSTRAEVANYFRTMWAQFAGPGSSSVEHLLIDGGHGVVFATISNSSANTGRPFTTKVAMHFNTEGDKITSMHLYEDSWAVSNAFA